MKGVLDLLFASLVESSGLIRRQVIINIVRPIAAFMLIAYGSLSLIDPKTRWIGYLMAADLLLVLLTIPIQRRTKNIAAVSHALVFLALPIQLSWFVTGGYFNHGYFWTIAWVPWAFLLVGRKGGIFWVAVLSVSSLALLALDGFNLLQVAYSPLEFVQAFFMLFVATFILFLYDRAYDQQRAFYEKLSSKAIDKLKNQAG